MMYDRVLAIARRDPGGLAIIDEDVRFTYGELLGRADACAATLAQEAGVGEGEIVATLLPNSADFAVALLAAARLGAILMPIDAALKDREVHGYFDRLAVRAAMTSTAFRDGRPDVVAHCSQTRWFSAESLPGPSNTATPRQTGPFEGVVAALSTSGTSGVPKVAGRTHRGLLAGFEGLNKIIGVKSGDRILGVTPFHHAHGLANAVVLSLLSGSTLVAMRRFLPRRLIEVVATYRVTVIVGSPFIFSAVADSATGPAAFASVRVAISSGEAVPMSTASAFEATAGRRIRELYGSSETGIMTFDGHPVEGVEVAVVDEHGAPVEPGKTGQVLVRSNHLAMGYLGEGGGPLPLRDGFYVTGDLGHVDAHGVLVLDGRLSGRLNIAGIKVDPVEIERVILSLPQVSEVAVTGVTGARGLTVIKAAVVVRRGESLELEAVIAHCRRELAEHKIPRIVELVDAIDVNTLGKRVHSA